MRDTDDPLLAGPVDPPPRAEINRPASASQQWAYIVKSSFAATTREGVRLTV